MGWRTTARAFLARIKVKWLFRTSEGAPALAERTLMQGQVSLSHLFTACYINVSASALPQGISAVAVRSG